MDKKTVINVIKFVVIGAYLAPTVIGGAMVIAGGTVKTLRKGINKSKYIKEIKKDFKLKREGVITVRYQEV